MKKTERKIYEPPQIHVVCLESKQTLLTGSTPTNTVDVDDWDDPTEIESQNIGFKDVEFW